MENPIPNNSGSGLSEPCIFLNRSSPFSSNTDSDRDADSDGNADPHANSHSHPDSFAYSGWRCRQRQHS